MKLVEQNDRRAGNFADGLREDFSGARKLSEEEISVALDVLEERGTDAYLDWVGDGVCECAYCELLLSRLEWERKQ